MENALTKGNVFLERLSLSTRGLDKDTENAKREIMQKKDAVLKHVAEILDKKAETLLNEVEQSHKDQRAELDKQTEATKRYVESIKQSVQLSKKIVEQGTEEEIISSHKMMLDNANNLLKKCLEYFKAPIPVVKCGYTPCYSAREERFNKNIAAVVESCLGEVKESTFKDKDKRPLSVNDKEQRIFQEEIGGTSSFKAKAFEKHSCSLFKNVKLSVYQGDITKETSDVIVNPATEDLKHDGGAAAAIVKAGGKSIQTESDEIMERRWYYSLNAGDVVLTAAGNLPCNFIVHAVGPRWSHYTYHQKDTAKKALLNAVLSSLAVASQNGATSISIPAISSGIFGVPVEICADVLFNAVTNFAENAAKSNSLKDIRFVNIDKPTSQVFEKEMRRRFGASIITQNVEVFHVNNVRGNERSNGNGQTPPPAWKQNPGAVVLKMEDDYKGSHDTPPGYNKKKGKGKGKGKGNQGFQPISCDENPKPGIKSPCDEECPTCLCDFTYKKTLDKCGHSFCSGCIDEAFKHQKKCPVCLQDYGPLIGNQPSGKMIVSYSSISLPGFQSCGSININYRFEEGVQGPNHPNPGKVYPGTTRCCYLPDNKEGNKVVKLLLKAFEQKLTFTIGRSSTLGVNNVITWNDIHHKTRRTGGPTNFGYPDPDYLKRVQEELAAKGIIE